MNNTKIEHRNETNVNLALQQTAVEHIHPLLNVFALPTQEKSSEQQYDQGRAVILTHGLLRKTHPIFFRRPSALAAALCSLVQEVGKDTGLACRLFSP